MIACCFHYKNYLSFCSYIKICIRKLSKFYSSKASLNYKHLKRFNTICFIFRLKNVLLLICKNSGDLTDFAAEQLEQVLKEVSAMKTSYDVTFFFTVLVPVATIWLVQTECQVGHEVIQFYLNNSYILSKFQID